MKGMVDCIWKYLNLGSDPVKSMTYECGTFNIHKRKAIKGLVDYVANSIKEII